MIDGVTIKVEGLAELERKMHELGPKIAEKALRSALNAAAQVIKKDAQQRAPVDTGRLANRAILVKRTKENASRTKEAYIVGVRQGRKEQKKDRDAFYWWYLEFGTKYIAAHPFIVPAFVAKKQEAFDRFKQKLRENIQKFAPLK